jgi:hypothetical protein
MKRVLRAASLIAAALAAGCATLPPPPPARTPSAAEKDDARRTLVAPYIGCMQAEARKQGGGSSAVDTSELRCGHHIQQLRRYGASKDYDALRWSDYIEQVEREGRAAAVKSSGGPPKRD